jgi:hypothetical protein
LTIKSNSPRGRRYQLATDITDPVVLLTLAQTVILTLTMVVFIMQFRSQNIAIKDAAYQKALDDYTTSISMLVERPELGRLVDDLARTAPESEAKAQTKTAEERALFGYMLLNYSLFERIYLLYAKKWIDEDTWSQWHTWMKSMARHPMFQEVHRRSQGTFDKAFQDLVDRAANPA